MYALLVHVNANICLKNQSTEFFSMCKKKLAVKH